MADLEKQSIVIELRKFRKKLRQIEKLEELERELTEEEFLKVTNKEYYLLPHREARYAVCKQS